MSKGKLLYETPSDKRIHKIFAILIYLIFLIFIIILIFNLDFPQIEHIIGKIIVSIFIFLAVFLLFSIVALHFLHPKFRIYEEGITDTLSEIMSAFRKEGKFIPYSNIVAFEVSPKGQRCIIFLTPKGFDQYIDKRSNVISKLIEHLRKQGIKEISPFCVNCGKELPPYDKCPYCNQIRF